MSESEVPTIWDLEPEEFVLTAVNRARERLGKPLLSRLPAGRKTARDNPISQALPSVRFYGICILTDDAKTSKALHDSEVFRVDPRYTGVRMGDKTFYDHNVPDKAREFYRGFLAGDYPELLADV